MVVGAWRVATLVGSNTLVGLVLNGLSDCDLQWHIAELFFYIYIHNSQQYNSLYKNYMFAHFKMKRHFKKMIYLKGLR